MNDVVHLLGQDPIVFRDQGHASQHPLRGIEWCCQHFFVDQVTL